MKYKVIGWTYYENDTYPCVEPSFSINEAVIDEIRKNNYVFTGYHHQEYSGCVPVLNTGEKVIYSQRGFGGVMANAKGLKGVYDYSLYAYTIDPESKNYNLPKEYVDKTQIVEKKALREKYQIEVDFHDFAKADIEKELILPDLEKYRYMDEGDEIVLVNGKDKFPYEIKEFVREKDLSVEDYFYFKYRTAYENREEIQKKFAEANTRISLKLEISWSIFKKD